MRARGSPKRLWASTHSKRSQLPRRSMFMTGRMGVEGEGMDEGGRKGEAGRAYEGAKGEGGRMRGEPDADGGERLRASSFGVLGVPGVEGPQEEP